MAVLRCHRNYCYYYHPQHKNQFLAKIFIVPGMVKTTGYKFGDEKVASLEQISLTKIRLGKTSSKANHIKALNGD